MIQRWHWSIQIVCWIGYWALVVQGIVSCGWGAEGIGVCGRLSGLQSAAAAYSFLFNLINPILLAVLVFVSRKTGAGGSWGLFRLTTYKWILVVGFGWVGFLVANTSYLSGALGTTFMTLDAMLTILLSGYFVLEASRLVGQIIKRRSL
ncbi:hypothetical protein [Bacillus sp. 3255]|uniref:hypothetical protein n=1 Tax=Bacillus sp. 3255 TaxID=2817904 RepID=UPI0028605770|nr:hypothetical protein [Bacillus sp. 3255]MDR6884329.1 hypothetical protein [Bacillus sp. 3255]